jgi:cytochrome c
MSLVVPGLALAAVICASTTAILSKAEAAGDAAAGEQVFARCMVCHSPKAGENKIGPSLAGVFGRKSGSAPGYNYSPALKSAGITWDEQELDKYLARDQDGHQRSQCRGLPECHRLSEDAEVTTMPTRWPNQRRRAAEQRDELAPPHVRHGAPPPVQECTGKVRAVSLRHAQPAAEGTGRHRPKQRVLRQPRVANVQRGCPRRQSSSLGPASAPQSQSPPDRLTVPTLGGTSDLGRLCRNRLDNGSQVNSGLLQIDGLVSAVLVELGAPYLVRALMLGWTEADGRSQPHVEITHCF